MTRATWLALAERAEKEGILGCINLDAAIHAAIGELPCRHAPAYSTSVDAALTTVPEGWAVAELRDRLPDRAGPYYRVRFWCPANQALGYRYPGEGATPALAMLAASCRARAEMETE